MATILALDHIVLSVADVERSVAFYRDVLGLGVERYDAWRAGQAPFPSMRISETTVIDLVRAPAEGERATRFTNLQHFCLVTGDDTLDSLVERLAQHGVRVTTGPAKRWGARGDGVSVYFRDPDDNEIELRTYAPAALARLQASQSAGAVH